MFSLISGLLQWLMQKEERKMALLGIDNAGKTTILEQMKTMFQPKGKGGMAPERITPTIGFNIGRIQIDKVMAIFWDLGGHANFRKVWKNYYSELQGIMYVVDAADPPRLEEVKQALDEVVSFEELTGVPILCMANKQDLPNAMSCEELSRALDLERRLGDRPHHVHPCSALRQNGLEAGIRWLLSEARKVPPRGDDPDL